MEKKTNILCMKIKFKDQLEKIVKKSRTKILTK